MAWATTNGDENKEEVGLDNIYRLGTSTPNYMMRGRWVDNQTFIIGWWPVDGSSGTIQIQAKLNGDTIKLNIQILIFKGQPMIIKGSK